jgi:hypothetical protein
LLRRICFTGRRCDSALRRDPDDMALGICEAAERDAGYVLGRPDRLPAELLGSLERYLDVLDADEEQHPVVAALQGPIAVASGSCERISAWMTG